jgi:iron complex outermembrane receptor protein
MLEPFKLSTATMFVRLALVATLVVAPSRVAVAQVPAGSSEAGQSAAQAPPEAPAAADEGVVVVTASRREETLLNAPATMTVVTAEVIRNAPSRDIVDLLRAVPGMNVVGTSARDFNVTARASTGTLADSTLVLLDGRSLYQDFFGFVLWDFMPVTVNEFKQIEVIRGPASAVWGANAMNGVINVISRTPREMVGTHVDLDFGQFNRTMGGQAFDGGGLFSINMSHAQAPTDRFAFKVSGSVFTQEAFARPVDMLPGTRIPPPPFENLGTLQPKLDARADYGLADGRQSITLAGGISGTEGIIHSGLGPFEIPRGSTFKYGRINYQRDRLKVQVFANAVDGHAIGRLVYGTDGQPLVFDFENQAYDVEVSNLHLIGERHLVSYGGNYRHNNFDLSLASGSGSRDEGGIYVQDQIFLSEQFRWVVGTRIDRFDVLNKNVFSPRTTFMIKPRPSQTIRLSYNRAFRAPSFVDNFMDVDLLAEVTLPTGPFRFPVESFGNSRLHEEALTAYEVGYIGQFGPITAGAAIYRNDTQNMIQFAQVESYTSANPPPGWPLPLAVLDGLAASGSGVPSRYAYVNYAGVVDKGLELSFETHVTPALAVFANYSWQAEPEPDGFDKNELNLQPRHRFNVGASFVRGQLFSSASTNVVTQARWQDVVSPGLQGWTEPYLMLNAALGMRSTDGRMDLAVRVTNLLNSDVRQHVYGDVVRRTIKGEVHLRF